MSLFWSGPLNEPRIVISLVQRAVAIAPRLTLDVVACPARTRPPRERKVARCRTSSDR